MAARERSGGRELSVGRSAPLREGRVLHAAFACWCVALVAVLAHAAWRPYSHSSFFDYWLAGSHWLKGELLYPADSKFLYSPITAAAFAVFALLNQPVSGVIWRVLIGGMLLHAAYVGASHVWKGEGAARLRGWSLLALLPLALSDLSNGQAGLLITALLLYAVLLAADRRWLLCAAAVAIAGVFKIYPLALGLILAAIYPRQFPWRLALWLAALFLLPFLLQHRAYVVAQYGNWFHRLSGDRRRFTGPYGTWRDAWLILRVARLPITATGWAILQITAAGAAAAFCAWGRRAQWSTQRALLAALCLAAVWMTLFGPATEAATYILLAPAATLGLIAAWHRAEPMRLRIGFTLAYGMLVFADALNSWAHPAHHVVLVHLVQPIAALIFLITAVVWIASDQYWPIAEIAP
jgi:hypothetical protein